MVFDTMQNIRILEKLDEVRVVEQERADEMEASSNILQQKSIEYSERLHQLQVCHHSFKIRLKV